MPTPLGQIFHLYNRLGFGISYKEAKEIAHKNINEIVNGLIISSGISTYLSVIKKEEIQAFKETIAEGKNKVEVQNLNKMKTMELNLQWMKQLIDTKNVLVEKQTLFWHNHFACRIPNPYLLQELNNTMRKFAFGNFRDLLVEVCKSPAILIYLNNQQNKKEHPNENFARELLELFTLGHGNYSETDIKETAKAFTGWGFKKDTGEFFFNEKLFDFSEKEIFGKKGNFGGEDVINMIISNKKTAYHIARKMYRYYVNENVNESRVKDLAEFYYQNQYNTGALIKKIFSSSYFFEEENIGSKIKSPIELLVGLSRQFKIKYHRYEALFKFQEILGMQLFYPPNVAGWSGGRNFIDSSTLIWRMKLPGILLSDVKPTGTKVPAPEVEEKEETENNTATNLIGAEINWEGILSELTDLDFEKLIKVYLAKSPKPETIQKIKELTALSKKEMVLSIVSLPEYSLV
ncbi:MAG: DUF1800 domain-containing protein [Sphingobacteriaceae bacterium]|nr:DUF1800 domain-containing protein [Sphingobacteriaceae bacterium]